MTVGSAEQEYPVVYWRFGARYEDEWTLSTIRHENDGDDCSIATVDGVPVREWLAGQNAEAATGDYPCIFCSARGEERGTMCNRPCPEADRRTVASPEERA